MIRNGYLSWQIIINIDIVNIAHCWTEILSWQPITFLYKTINTIFCHFNPEEDTSSFETLANFTTLIMYDTQKPRIYYSDVPHKHVRVSLKYLRSKEENSLSFFQTSIFQSWTLGIFKLLLCLAHIKLSTNCLCLSAHELAMIFLTQCFMKYSHWKMIWYQKEYVAH
jgi:hypothetical protein